MSKEGGKVYKEITIEALCNVLDGYMERRMFNQILVNGELEHFKSLKREKNGKKTITSITSEAEFKEEMIQHMIDNPSYSRRIDKMIDDGVLKIDRKNVKKDEFEYPTIQESQREKAYWDKELVRQKALEMQRDLIQIGEVMFIFETFTNYIKKQLEVLPKRMSDQIFLKFGVDKNQVKLCLDEEIRNTLKDFQKDIMDYKNKFSEKEEE